MTSTIFASEQMSFEEMFLGFERFQGYLTTLSRLEESQQSDEYDDDISAFPGELIEVVGEESLNLGEKLKNMIKSLVAFFRKIVVSIKDRLQKLVSRKELREAALVKAEKSIAAVKTKVSDSSGEEKKIVESLASEIYSNVKFEEIPSREKLKNFEREIELTLRVITDNGRLVSFFDKFINDLFNPAVMKEESPIPEFDMAKLINVSAANNALKASGRELIVMEHVVKIGKNGTNSILLKDTSFKGAGWPNPFLDDFSRSLKSTDVLHPDILSKVGDTINKISGLLDRLPNQIDSGAVTREVANRICMKAHEAVQALSSVSAINTALYLAYDSMVNLLIARLRKMAGMFNEKSKSE